MDTSGVQVVTNYNKPANIQLLSDLAVAKNVNFQVFMNLVMYLEELMKKNLYCC